MNILVCISSVPDTTSKINFTENNTKFDKNGIQFVINPYDEFGLTKAIMLKEKFQANVSVITVGDATSQLLLNMDLIPFLHIIDGQEKRQKRSVPLPVEPKDIEICRVIHTKNNAGEISDENFDLIKNIFHETPRTPVRLLVDGEEDLLVLPVCLFAPENSVVMYGQPNEGLVIAEITDELRDKVQKIVNQMK